MEMMTVAVVFLHSELMRTKNVDAMRGFRHTKKKPKNSPFIVSFLSQKMTAKVLTHRYQAFNLFSLISSIFEGFFRRCFSRIVFFY